MRIVRSHAAVEFDSNFVELELPAGLGRNDEVIFFVAARDRAVSFGDRDVLGDSRAVLRDCRCTEQFTCTRIADIEVIGQNVACQRQAVANFAEYEACRSTFSNREVRSIFFFRRERERLFSRAVAELEGTGLAACSCRSIDLINRAACVNLRAGEQTRQAAVGRVEGNFGVELAVNVDELAVNREAGRRAGLFSLEQSRRRRVEHYRIAFADNNAAGCQRRHRRRGVFTGNFEEYRVAANRAEVKRVSVVELNRGICREVANFKHCRNTAGRSRRHRQRVAFARDCRQGRNVISRFTLDVSRFEVLGFIIGNRYAVARICEYKSGDCAGIGREVSVAAVSIDIFVAVNIGDRASRAARNDDVCAAGMVKRIISIGQRENRIAFAVNRVGERAACNRNVSAGGFIAPRQSGRFISCSRAGNRQCVALVVERSKHLNAEQFAVVTDMNFSNARRRIVFTRRGAYCKVKRLAVYFNRRRREHHD